MSTLPDRERFGRYEALLPLASGGMGEVFVGRLRGPGGFTRAVAIKTVLRSRVERDGAAEMFLAEARNAACIHSPHVIQTLDVGTSDDGRPYLVMELVIGEDLATLSELADEVPVDVAVELGLQIAEGLHAAHTATSPEGKPLGLVHCDVSPPNVLVGLDGRARVIDFGIAHAVQEHSRTMTDSIRGKVGYVAPEQVQHDGVDARTDVFGLGVVLWELLAGRFLFRASHPFAVLEAILRQPVPSLVEVRPDVPKPVADVVAKCLCRDREARWASAHEMLEALRKAARRAGLRPSTERVASWVAGCAGPILEERREQISETLAVTRSAPPAPASRKALPLTLGVAASVTVAAAALLVWPSSSPAVDEPRVVEAPEPASAPSSPPLASRDTPPHPEVEAPPAPVEVAPNEPAPSRPRRPRHRRVAAPPTPATSVEPPPVPGPRPEPAASPAERPAPTPPAEVRPGSSLIGLDAFDEFVGGRTR